LLVVRLGAMGDILHALPAVTALRRAHPSWIIDWVIEPAWRHLLTSANGRTAEALSAEQPLVDRIYLAPVKEWARRPLSPGTAREIRELRRALKMPEYEAVLDFQGAVRSAWLARMAGARRVIGESDPREWPARWLYNERVATRGAHVIEQDVELAAAVAGDELEAIRPALPVDPDAEIWCDGLFAEWPGKPVVLLNPGAGWGAKRWPVERYGAVARELALKGFRVLVNAGPGELGLASDIAVHSGGTAAPVICTVPQLIALTRRIALAIAGDTGPLHLACALGRPVVGIYGPTDPKRNGPCLTRFEVLRSPSSRRDHARKDAPEPGLLTITPGEVLEAVERVLGPEGVE
jgi:heptosyltransferase-1